MRQKICIGNCFDELFLLSGQTISFIFNFSWTSKLMMVYNPNPSYQNNIRLVSTN